MPAQHAGPVNQIGQITRACFHAGRNNISRACMDAWDGVAVVSPERGVIRRSYKSPTGGGQGSGGIKHKPITESLLMDDQGYGMQRRPKLIIVRDGETTGPKKINYTFEQGRFSREHSHHEKGAQISPEPGPSGWGGGGLRGVGEEDRCVWAF